MVKSRWQKERRAMVTGWRDRLIDAVEADGRSDRSISLAAGLGPNFVNELRNQAKEPGVEKIMKLADELNVSLTYIFMGTNITAEDEAFLRLYRQYSDEERAGLMAILKKNNP